SLHGDSRVLEPGDVDDADHPVLTHGAHEEFAIEDRTVHKGHVHGNEGLVPAGEVVEHHRAKAGLREGPHDMRSDRASTTSYEPGHASHASGWSSHRAPWQTWHEARDPAIGIERGRRHAEEGCTPGHSRCRAIRVRGGMRGVRCRPK